MQALQPSCCTLSLSLSPSLCTSDSWPWHFSGAAPLDAYCLPCRSRLSFPLPLPLCQETSSGAAAPPDHDLGTLSLTLRLRLFPLCNLCFRFLLLSEQQLNRHYSSQQCICHPGHIVAPQNVHSSQCPHSKKASTSAVKLALICPDSEDFQTLAN